MTPNTFQRLAMEKEADQDEIRQRVFLLGTAATRLDNAARGLADEAGELSGVVKNWLEYGRPLDREAVLEECGDALWRVCQALAAVGYTLQDAMEANVHKLAKRYPTGHTKEAELARDPAAERMVMATTRESILRSWADENPDGDRDPNAGRYRRRPDANPTSTPDNPHGLGRAAFAPLTTCTSCPNGVK